MADDIVQGVPGRLPVEIRKPSGGTLDQLRDGTAVRDIIQHPVVVDRTVVVHVDAVISGPVPQVFAGQGDPLIGQGRVKTQDDHIGPASGCFRFRIEDPQPGAPECFDEIGRPDNKEGILPVEAPHLFENDLCRQKHLFFRDGNTHSGQLVQVVLLVFCGVVREKAVAASGIPQFFQKGNCEGEETIAQIDGPVHVEDKTADLPQPADIFCLFPLKVCLLNWKRCLLRDCQTGVFLRFFPAGVFTFVFPDGPSDGIVHGRGPGRGGFPNQSLRRIVGGEPVREFLRQSQIPQQAEQGIAVPDLLRVQDCASYFLQGDADLFRMDRGVQGEKKLFDFGNGGQIMADGPEDFLPAVPDCFQTVIPAGGIIFTGWNPGPQLPEFPPAYDTFADRRSRRHRPWCRGGWLFFHA